MGRPEFQISLKIGTLCFSSHFEQELPEFQVGSKNRDVPIFKSLGRRYFQVIFRIREVPIFKSFLKQGRPNFKSFLRPYFQVIFKAGTSLFLTHF